MGKAFAAALIATLVLTAAIIIGLAMASVSVVAYWLGAPLSTINMIGSGVVGFIILAVAFYFIEWRK